MRELAQHITDLVENSTRAGARRVVIELDEQPAEDILVLRVSDDGSGMSPEVVEMAMDPFFTSRTCRRVGLGLPLLAASAQRCAGNITITSTPGVGTTVEATFQASHIDTPPIGDLPSTVVCAIVGHPDVDVCFRKTYDGRSFDLDSGTIRQELGEVPITHPAVLEWLERVVSEGIAATSSIAADKEEANA